MDETLTELVLRTVELVPPGRLVSYGDVAALLGTGPGVSTRAAVTPQPAGRPAHTSTGALTVTSAAADQSVGTEALPFGATTDAGAVPASRTSSQATSELWAAGAGSSGCHPSSQSSRSYVAGP
ncbi:hypothetical protein JOE56_001238 [Brevibacterium paucivorans]|uniref:Methylated-DNA-[protein]-cysteine S-methyltransferase DNA binding domain-containing protein n=1 Tax=Brevibacterium paucivorans TaxID=170994 RepID=A0ABS2SKM5_9MICO|nr:hypothetical protein [Brevibacterium paucivorans]